MTNMVEEEERLLLLAVCPRARQSDDDRAGEHEVCRRGADEGGEADVLRLVGERVDHVEVEASAWDQIRANRRQRRGSRFVGEVWG